MPLAALRYLHRTFKCRYLDHRVEVDALLSRLHRGEVAIDVGANKGAFLWPLARRVGSDGRVVAIEPQPSLAAYLRDTMAAVRLHHVDVVEGVASDRRGTAVLHVPSSGTSPGATVLAGDHVPSGWQGLQVRAFPLDDLLADEPRRIGALKVDVEGHEPEVFAGAEVLIARHRPVIVFECEERHLAHSTAASSVREVVAWLSSRGYAVSFVDRGWLVGADEYSPDRHQRRSGARYWDGPDYCNNFVAVPRSEARL